MNNFFEFLKLTSLYEIILPVEQKRELFYWNKRGRTPPTPQLVKQKIIKDYARKYSIATFVETGTYLGSTTKAVKDTFSKIFTIELDKLLYKRAQQKFKKYPHITIIQGDSAKVVFKLLKKITAPTLFWLDAHYSKGITAKGEVETPINEELNSIFNHKIKNHIILIDDVDVFTGKNNYPTIKGLRDKIIKLGLEYKLILRENMMVIQPKNKKHF